MYVSCCTVAAASGKGRDRLSKDAAAWLDANGGELGDGDRVLAKRAISRMTRGSELKELWDENGADTEWHAGVRELVRRLNA